MKTLKKILKDLFKKYLPEIIIIIMGAALTFYSIIILTNTI